MLSSTLPLQPGLRHPVQRARVRDPDNPRHLQGFAAGCHATAATAAAIALTKSRSRRRSQTEADWHRAFAPPVQLQRPVRSAPQRFNVDDPAAIVHLKEEGFAVFGGVLDQLEVQMATDLFWKYMELSTQNAVRREDPLTWQKHNWPGQDDNGIINSGGIGQSEFMWYIRRRPPVMRAFANLWGVSKEDLLVSFDGCCAFRPPAVDVRWRTRGGWLHTDQNGRTTGSDFACAQGLVSLTESNESTGGFAAIPGSHKCHAEIFQRWPLDRENDFFVLPRCDELLSPSATKPQLLPLHAGDMVLWDSRLLHCNVPGFHPFDEMDLQTSLADVGLQEASAALVELTSVADAVWTWAAHEATLKELFESWALPKSLHGPVAKQFQLWAGHLAQDLHVPTSQPCLSRLAAYVCATPRPGHGAPNCHLVALRRRMAAALMGCTTSHWPERSIVTDMARTPLGLANFQDLELSALRQIGCQSWELSLAQAEMRELLATLPDPFQRLHPGLTGRPCLEILK